MGTCRSISATKNSRPQPPLAARWRIRKASVRRGRESGMRAPIENTAKRYAQLVEKLEAARRRGRLGSQAR
jgi:hypothetical protein